MKHALKIESVDINEKIADGIVEALKDFASSLKFRNERIEDLECRSRDGFSPYSHNKGGISCAAFRDQYSCQFETTGFKNADKTIEKYRKYNVEHFLNDNPAIPKDESEWSDEQREKFDEYQMNDSESTVLYSLDAMYHGIERGVHSLNLRICVCVKDAPYHREYDDLISIDVRFKTVKSLENKLNKLLKRVDLKCFKQNLMEAY